VQKQIQNSAYDYQISIENEDRIIVGVNGFRVEEETKPDLLRVDPAIGELQKEKLSSVKEKRDNKLVEEKLMMIREAAETSGNLIPLILEAVKEYATLGEICGVLRDVFGEYRESVIL